MMTANHNREETKRRLEELTREYCVTHNPEIVEEIYRLARDLDKMEKEKQS
jgi:hypothetical protein